MSTKHVEKSSGSSRVDVEIGNSERNAVFQRTGCVSRIFRRGATREYPAGKILTSKGRCDHNREGCQNVRVMFDYR